MSLLRWLADDSRVMAGAIMTTFPFSPAFFERSVLPALRNKNGEIQTALLIDEAQYTDLLETDDDSQGLAAEQPRGLGQAYQVGPVGSPMNRTFHPKVHLLTGSNRVQVVVGSANLTHPGLTTNREIITKFELPREPDDDSDTRATSSREAKARLYTQVDSFLRQLVDSPFGDGIGAVTEQTIQEVLAAGEWVEDVEGGSLPADAATLLHSLDRPIIEQLMDRISDRGESIVSVDVVAPFYGTSMRVPEYFTDRGIETQLWVQNGRTQIDSQHLENWLGEPNATAVAYGDDRYVHGKLLHVQTEQAAYCISGSPNASQAAQLSAVDSGGNIEAAVCRRRPDPQAFDYLFEQSPFTSATSLNVDEFSPASLPSRFDVDVSGDADTDTRAITLADVGYFRYQAFDGGRIEVTGRADGPTHATMSDEGATLVVTDPSRNSPQAVSLSPWGFEWSETADGYEFSYEQKRTSGEGNIFSDVGIARLEAGEQESNERWMQVHTPAADDPTDDELAESGTTAVPERIFQLYSSDGDSQQAIIGSLGTLLEGLNQRSENLPTRDSPKRSDAPRGGLSLSSWSSSSERSANASVAAFLDGWQDEIQTFTRQTSSSNRFIDEVGQRLGAINLVDLQLLLWERANPNQDVPLQAVTNSIKDVYTKHDRDGQVKSLIGNFYHNLRVGSDSVDADSAFDNLQTEVVPQLILGAIMTEDHLSGDPATYHNQHGWSFEHLIGQSYPAGYPDGEHFETAHLDTVIERIDRHIDRIRPQVEENPSLRRQASHRYFDESSLRETVIELFGRSILYAGPDAIREIRRSEMDLRQLEDVYETHVAFLDRGQRRSVESML